MLCLVVACAGWPPTAGPEGSGGALGRLPVSEEDAVSRGDERHAILLARRRQVGDRYRVRVRALSEQRVQLGEADSGPRIEVTVAALEARVQVLAVDPLGRVQRSLVHIEDLVLEVDGRLVLAFPRNLEVRVERGGRPGYRGEGMTLSAGMRAALELVLDAAPLQPQTDDDLFGSAAGRQVGERWAVNSRALLRGLAAGGMHMSEITGEVHLQALRACGVQRCMELHARMSGQVEEVPALPSAFELRSADMQMQADRVLPLSHSGTVVSERSELSVQLRGILQTQTGPVPVSFLRRQQKLVSYGAP